MGWEPLIRFDGKKSSIATQLSASFGWPGSTNFQGINASNTGATSRTDMSQNDPLGLYNGFFSLTNISKIALVDGTSTSKIPTNHNNYLIYDLYETTGEESISDILLRLDTYQRTTTSFARNDSVWSEPSVINHTASFSGLLVESGGTSFKSNAGGTPLPDKFCVMGINRDSDNDIQALCSYYGSLTQGKGDSWRGANPAQTFWSYWGHDFHSNSQTQTIGISYQSQVGIPTGCTYSGTVYLMGYGGSEHTLSVSGSSSLQSLSVDSDNVIDMIYTGDSDTWSISPSLPAGLSFNPSTGRITGTPTAFDISGTTYTITVSGQSVVTNSEVVINVRDTHIQTYLDLGYNITDTSIAHEIVVTESPIDLPISLSPEDNSLNQKRRALVDLILTRPHNNGYNHFIASKADLVLPSIFPKDEVRVYRGTTNTIDLAGLPAIQGVYSTIYNQGEYVNFLNVGGSQTVRWDACGSGIFSAKLDNSLVNTYSEGENPVIGGVSWIIGSIGTEGTNDSNICLAGDTIIETTSGRIRIDSINNQHYIVHPSGTSCVISQIRVIYSTPVVCIKKSALAPGIPDQDTYITNEHRVWNPKTESWDYSVHLINDDTIVAVNRNDNYYYNLWTEQHLPMIANSMIVETLDHNNINVKIREGKNIYLIQNEI